MRKITLVRKPAQGKAVPGIISFDLNEGPFSFQTLENADFLIPEGEYPIEWTWSPKFKKPLPEILNVPDRSGIRIHRGTLPEHSKGCILTDMAGMAHLQVFFNLIQLENRYKDENEPKESALICITHA
jgi:hypothetical protein